MDETELSRDAFLARYLKLNFYNVDKAEQQLENYGKYCKETNVNELERWVAKQDEIVFNILFGATDHDGNPG